MALNSICATACSSAKRPSGVPRPRRGNWRGETRRGRSGRPGAPMGSGDASASTRKRPSAKACAALAVAASLAAGSANSRQRCAEANRHVAAVVSTVVSVPARLLCQSWTQLQHCGGWRTAEEPSRAQADCASPERRNRSVRAKYMRVSRALLGAHRAPRERTPAPLARAGSTAGVQAAKRSRLCGGSRPGGAGSWRYPNARIPDRADRSAPRR